VPAKLCAVAEYNAQYTRHRRSRFGHADRLFQASASVREGSETCPELKKMALAAPLAALGISTATPIGARRT
jgi:hypothetical protein